jgi:deoxyadenosine/deoxycytidine kinase
MQKLGRLIYVESIIGGGKTTFVNEIGERLNYRIFREPVESNPYLPLFYKDMKAYAYTMQIYLLFRRIKIQQSAAAECLVPDQGYNGAMIDRSLGGDAVFEEMLHDGGYISDIDHEAYLTALECLKLLIYPPTTLVFLDVRPEIAFKRIKERGRKAEGDMTLEYLVSLAKYYKKFIKNAKDGKYPWSHAVQVRHMDWNPATVTAEEWDAVAANLLEEWG